MRWHLSLRTNAVNLSSPPTQRSALQRLPSGRPPTQHVEKDKPNVILVMADNVGFTEFGVNGNDKIKTPHLDRFAREGVRFNRFYCNPMCAPTPASLMTGRYYYRTGVIHTSRGGAKMHCDEITIAEYLKTADYVTGIFGKWHLGDNYPMQSQARN